jgi:hypothetical protein
VLWRDCAIHTMFGIGTGHGEKPFRESRMDNQQGKPGSLPDKPSFFGWPESFFLWARLGSRFWGGVLFGIGLGFFVASWLMELEMMKTVWTGFIAIVLIGLGLGMAVRTARREWLAEKVRPQGRDS